MRTDDTPAPIFERPEAQLRALINTYMRDGYANGDAPSLADALQLLLLEITKAQTNGKHIGLDLASAADVAAWALRAHRGEE